MKILNEKGAVGFDTTYDPSLDLFARLGSFPREPNDEQMEVLRDLTRKAFIFNEKETAIILFNLRDRLEGVGHRKIFRELFWFAIQFCPTFEKLIPLIPEYGRWDDLFSLLHSKYKSVVADLVRKQLAKDLQSNNPSLLGKWLPSINTSSKEAKTLANILAKELGLKPADYRKTCSRLRKRIGIVEHNICTQNFEDLKYSNVPSLAMSKYTNIFETKDRDNYHKFLDDVVNGKAKINTSTLNIVDMALSADKERVSADLLNAQFDNLPDFGKCQSLVCMDGSGSMYTERYKVRPIDVAKSLTIYCSTRNEVYKNQFITFGDEVKFVTLKSTNFCDKIKELSKYDDCGTTNFENVFLQILNHAKFYNLTKDQMIKNLIVVSDMQFDDPCCFKYANDSVYRKLQELFKAEGYEMPKIIFWNVGASVAMPITVDDYNATILSGWSQNMLRYILSGSEITPRLILNEVLESKRYAKIAEIFG